MRWAVALLLALWGTTSWAAAPSGDERYLTIAYRANSVARVSTAREAVQTVLFAPDERIGSVMLSDPDAYLVIVSGRGDSLALRANSVAAKATMTVQTDQRSYAIELIAGMARAAPAIVQFSYSAPAAPVPRSIGSISGPAGVSYRVSGSRALRPESIKDDGAKTYIAWRDDQAMPAIFAVGPSGREEMVDGYVRGGLFTIDRVHSQLIFRIDRQRAKARRLEKADRHGK